MLKNNIIIRTIKFRAYDDTGVLEDVVMLDNTTIIVFNNGEIKKYKVKAIVQFTGLKDKNGVEIYEGDILKTTGLYREHFIVEYSDRSFELYDGKDGVVSDEHNIWDAYEIIGNVYENQEYFN